jgi:polyisoprenoid-binding protein YceI
MNHKLFQNLKNITNYYLLLPLFTFLILTPTDIIGKNLNLNKEKSKIEFVAEKLGKDKVEGTFKSMISEASFSDSNQFISLKGDISTNSIETGSWMKNNHLKDKEFLDTSSYPSISFFCTSLNETTMNGQFTMKGKTFPISFSLTKFEHLENELRIEGHTRVQRLDYDSSEKKRLLKSTIDVYLSVLFDDEN